MKALLLALLTLVLLALPAQPTTIIRGPVGVASDIFLNENFEGSGTAAGWTNVGTAPNHDSTTSPIEGSHSLRATQSASSTYYAHGAAGEVWYRFAYRVDSLAGTPWVIEVRTAADAILTRVRVLSTGALRFYNPNLTTAGSSTAGQVTAGTNYWIWVRYVKGTGSNAIYELYLSTDRTKPGSATFSVTNGAATDDAARVRLDGTGSTTTDWDEVIGSYAVIGSGVL
jgi:hypothetical protein